VQLPHRPYPALVPSRHAREEVDGLLIERLEPTEWRVLDDFEDDMYELSLLPLTDGRIGWAYVCLNKADVLAELWDYEAFAENDLADYLERCREWRTSRP
jgi:Gamma-glutamyl cyclotransferase, AIG2-like